MENKIKISAERFTMHSSFVPDSDGIKLIVTSPYHEEPIPVVVRAESPTYGGDTLTISFDEKWQEMKLKSFKWGWLIGLITGVSIGGVITMLIQLWQS